MPVYNGGHYFRLALESALAQTYGNTEVIVVNDGSTDGGETDAIAREFGDRIRYFVQSNLGVGGALNTAVANMTGDYFTWLSHDDIHLPHKAHAQVNYAARFGRSDVILFSDYDLIDHTGKVIATPRAPREKLVRAPMLALLHTVINGCTLFIPASIIRAFGPFDEGQRYTQDYDLWNKIIAQYDFFHQAEVLVQYRLHPGQGSRNPGAATEGDALWRRIIDSRSEAERVQLFGSTYRFFEEMSEFLEQTPYKKAAAHARSRIGKSEQDLLVSIIIPFWNEAGAAARAARSALAQTHERIEIIMVDDGSAEDTSEIQNLVRSDRRIRVIRYANSSAAAARNHGLGEAQGDYVAFLNAADIFLPQKVQRQLDLMQRRGYLVSHSSYHVRYPQQRPELGLVTSGAFSGAVYPAIIAHCPIATSTVVLHHTLIAGGFRFPDRLLASEDVLAWITLATHHEILGIEEPLSVIEWSDENTPAHIEKSVLRLMKILWEVEDHPIHHRHGEQIIALRQALQQLVRNYKSDHHQLP